MAWAPKRGLETPILILLDQTTSYYDLPRPSTHLRIPSHNNMRKRYLTYFPNRENKLATIAKAYCGEAFLLFSCPQ